MSAESMDDSTWQGADPKMLARDIASDIFSFLVSVAGDVRVDGIISGGNGHALPDTTSL